MMINNQNEIGPNESYIPTFESVGENKIKINLKINIIDYFSVETVEKIKSKNNLMKEFSEKEMIDYFNSLLSIKENISFKRINEYIYNLSLTDKDRQKIIEFELKRKDIEEELLKMYKKIEEMKKQIEINSKILGESDNENKKKIECIETDCPFQNLENINTKKNLKNINNNSSNNIINETNNSNNNINNDDNNNNFQKINNSIQLSINDNKNINENSKISNSKLGTMSLNNYNNVLNNFPNNINNLNSNDITEKNNLNSDILNKNNNINPIDNIEKKFEIKETKIINQENEQCEVFIAFNLSNGHPIILWTTKEQNNTIQFLNLYNNQKNYSRLAHNNKINYLQYFHNENASSQLSECVISLSQQDEEIMKFWIILEERKLQIKTKINFNYLEKRVEKFCIIGNKDYSKDNVYLIMYGKNKINKKEIFYYKLDNRYRIVNNLINISYTDEIINYLDSFYYSKQNKLYLINCNNDNLNITQNPLDLDYCKKIFFQNKNEKDHLVASIIEKNDYLEIFDSNSEGIYIWIFKDNFPELINIISFNNRKIYDFFLLNSNYLWSLTEDDISLIHIDEKKIIKTIENSIDKQFPIIRKIENEKAISIIGLNSNHKLNIWSFVNE